MPERIMLSNTMTMWKPHHLTIILLVIPSWKKSRLACMSPVFFGSVNQEVVLGLTWRKQETRTEFWPEHRLERDHWDQVEKWIMQVCNCTENSLRIWSSCILEWWRRWNCGFLHVIKELGDARLTYSNAWSNNPCFHGTRRVTIRLTKSLKWALSTSYLHIIFSKT
jgi:hypothetical protein